MADFSSTEEISKQLGAAIRSSRKNQKISQKALASGICSQSMISSIENGEYVANFILLGRICKRLNISIDHILFTQRLDTDIISDFFCRIKFFCESHQYNMLLEYMNDSKIIDILENSEDLQLYYYYFGCALYQATSEFMLAKRYLQLALNCSKTNQRKSGELTPLDISIRSSLGIVCTDLGLPEKASQYFSEVHQVITNSKYTIYDESINAFFYQYAFSLIKHKNISMAIQLLEEGISFAGKHQSHYMLSNIFYLLSKCHERQDNKESANSAFESYKLMNSIFHDSVFKHF